MSPDDRQTMAAERFHWKDFIGRPNSEGEEAGSDSEVAILRRMLHGLFEETPVGLFALDNETGRFLLVNREFERITGHTREDLLQSSFTRVIAPEDLERIREHRRRRMRRDPTLPKHYEMLLITRSGERRAVLFDANPIPFSDVISGSVRDVTRQKIRQDPALHLQRMDGLASLASGLANEFNNLLSAISGYADLALSGTPPESRVAQMLRKIHGASREALLHVQDLTAFSRSGSNAMESVDLGNLARTLAGVLPCTAPTKSFDVSQSIAPGINITRGDVSQLEQALLNVSLNAIDALPTSGGTIDITLSRQMVDQMEPGGLPLGPYVQVTITDSGHGITPEDIERVCEPFFTTRSSARNTGLGLSTTHGIIRDHGGALSIRSEPGRGTAVTILLPLDKSPETLVPARLEGRLRAPPRRASILIIDDQEFVNELLRDVIEDMGHEAHCFTSATEALAAVLDGTVRPDLAIVDLMMPGMDGRTFIREARSGGLKSPILVTSGYSPAEEGDRDLRGETCGFLRKPFRPAELRQMVESALPHDSGPSKEGS